MLRFIYGKDFPRYPKLYRSMFLDRADQFKTRLGWDVTVDPLQEERDKYDLQNPLYVIWQTSSGVHGGSMRVLPTLGPCMLNQYFSHVIEGSKIESPHIRECTRFCLPYETPPRVAAALLLAGAELMLFSNCPGCLDAVWLII